MSPAFWSLTPEVVFYLMLPFLILRLPGWKGRLSLFVALFLICIPTRAWAALTQPGEAAPVDYGEFDPYTFSQSFPTTLLYHFVAGMLIRMLVERLNERPSSPWRERLTFTVFAISAAYLLVPSAFSFLYPRGLGSVAEYLWVETFSDVMLIAFFASAVLGAPVLRRLLLNWKPLAFVGLISYSMFVFHQTVLLFVMSNILLKGWFEDWITQSALHAWGGFLLYFVFVYTVIGLVAYLGFRFIETPFLRLKPR
jgi:peptidoglycan/LPS O-acetylase OafA/YrhL